MEVKHDFTIDIATAPSRLAKRWKNREWRWSDFLEKCSKTRYTRETVAEYFAMSKDDQSALKDVGGFVGGHLRDGMRKSGYVDYRTMLTLDIDEGRQDVWGDFKLEYDCAALLYTTHKHKREAPRYRLVIPLDRPVTTDEYEPIARRVAADIGIDQFDTTTYQPQRLFYWPSTSKDGAWDFQWQDAEPLSADSVLGRYADYHDASQWPVGAKEGEVVRHSMREAGDPTEKRGAIGAFCRAYSIEDAIETFLPDVYTPTSITGRYTYAQGSVAGGLVCYSHMFAYSHHDTDPASGKLCNAFDLVRIHKFGDMDGTRTYDDPTKMPSFRKMVEFAGEDGMVKRELATEAAESARKDFDAMGYAIEGTDDGDEWKESLDLTKDGRCKSNAKNISVIIENDPSLRGHFWLDEFSHRFSVFGRLPWDAKDRLSNRWSNSDDAHLRIFFETRYGITGKEKIKDGRTAAFNRHGIHPIREYIQSLEWDGTERLERLIIDYVGAEDTDLTRMMTRKHFVAAVARVMEPGCKYDYCLILTGEEGIGKSTLFNVMGGDWFSDSMITMEGKTGMELASSAWIIELAELGSLKRAEVDQVKAFISKRVDSFRPAYGEMVEDFPRQCVFCGTTNEALFLKGDDGNRRFWVIKVEGEKKKYGDSLEQLKRDRDQIWAEAYHYYKKGESLFLPYDMEMKARKRQKEFNDNVDDPVRDMLVQFLDMKLPADWNTYDLQRRRNYINNPDPLDAEGTETRDKVCALEFLREAMALDPKDKNFQYLKRRVNKYMKEMDGWDSEMIASRHSSNLYGVQKSFKRIVTDDEDL